MARVIIYGDDTDAIHATMSEVREHDPKASFTLRGLSRYSPDAPNEGARVIVIGLANDVKDEPTKPTTGKKKGK